MDLNTFQSQISAVLAGRKKANASVSNAATAAWLKMLAGFDELLCLPLVQIEQLPHQLRVAKRVMRVMKGRAILADEVGLGKSVEAGLILREYLTRSMAKTALILVPPSLISQWSEEMKSKFGMDSHIHRSGTSLPSPLPSVLLMSTATARREPMASALAETFFDTIIVDEAHHLKNKSSTLWKMVNRLRSKFLLLLTATPVQNSLDDLYNLVTLLRPGQLETPKQFRERFSANGSGKKLQVKNTELLRRLTSEVMVRTTRSEAGLDLPPRQARTAIVTPTAAEAEIYQDASQYLKQLNVSRMRLLATQRLLGSLPMAALAGLREADFNVTKYDLTVSSKLKYLDGYIREAQAKNPGGKILIFTQFTESHAQILKILSRHFSCASVIGGQDRATRDRETERFMNECSILVSTDAGSEGRNFQFCHHLVNFDIPWNPMRIEQRIGRLHRFGQKEPVEILNLCQRDSLEESLLWLIDQKLNLFELVVGELSSILGDLEDDQSFEQTVGDMWIESPSWSDFRHRIEELGKRAGDVYQEQVKIRRLDAELFGGRLT